MADSFIQLADIFCGFKHGEYLRVTKYELAVCKLFAVITNGGKYHTIPAILPFILWKRMFNLHK